MAMEPDDHCNRRMLSHPAPATQCRLSSSGQLLLTLWHFGSASSKSNLWSAILIDGPNIYAVIFAVTARAIRPSDSSIGAIFQAESFIWFLWASETGLFLSPTTFPFPVPICLIRPVEWISQWDVIDCICTWFDVNALTARSPIVCQFCANF
jgi:hypothetical protein